jgi:GT2 family glycosyltransferase
VRLSVIVPFHRNLSQLARCLRPLADRPPDSELIVVADGAVEDCQGPVTEARGALMEISGPVGPAIARNRGAARARGEILLFVDSDVVVPPEIVRRLVDIFDTQPEIDAVFGAYDEEPGDAGYVSQYKNLAHSFVHQSSQSDARTFWAGFGAVRRPVFVDAGGFDERFRRPSMEDIDLGYRMWRRGRRILMDHTLRVCHLKRWTIRSLVMTDIFDRGIPWTQLIIREGRLDDDLNIRVSQRASVVLAFLLVGLLVGTWWRPWLLVPAAASAALLVGLSWPLYQFFLSRRGPLFTLGVFPLQLLYHLYNGLSFAIGAGVFLAERWLGLRLPGAVPQTRWGGPLPSSNAARLADSGDLR